MQVKMDDFTRAIGEIKPAFGVSVDQLELCMPNGLLHYGARFTRLYETGLKFVSQVVCTASTLARMPVYRPLAARAHVRCLAPSCQDLALLRFMPLASGPARACTRLPRAIDLVARRRLPASQLSFWSAMQILGYPVGRRWPGNRLDR